MDEKQLQKDIFSNNLKKYLRLRNKSQADLVNDLGITSSTASDWVNAKKYPRMDKVQMIADYLGIYKSDLIEDKSNIDDPLGDYEENVEYLKDKPELLNLYQDIVDNDRLVILFDKAKKLSPQDLEQVLNIIDTFNKETK